jgi:hypothetical protein
VGTDGHALSTPFADRAAVAGDANRRRPALIWSATPTRARAPEAFLRAVAEKWGAEAEPIRDDDGGVTTAVVEDESGLIVRLHDGLPLMIAVEGDGEEASEALTGLHAAPPRFANSGSPPGES